MSSPCVKLCILDAESGLCQGCGRTLDEIAGWGTLAEAERLAIMAALPARLAERRKDPPPAADHLNPSAGPSEPDRPSTNAAPHLTSVLK